MAAEFPPLLTSVPSMLRRTMETAEAQGREARSSLSVSSRASLLDCSRGCWSVTVDRHQGTWEGAC